MLLHEMLDRNVRNYPQKYGMVFNGRRYTYEEFAKLFSFDDLDDTLAMVFMLLEIFPKQAVDWLFRFYAAHYTQENWDPHYYTSLYAALRLYLEDTIEDQIACRNAAYKEV